MYSQLSAGQQQALENQECPHCHSRGQVRQIFTRNGPTVKCGACGKKVYRPRGRAVARGGSITTSGDSGGQTEMSVQPTGHGESQQGQQEGQQEGSGQQQSGQTGQMQSGQMAQAAAKALNKPLSQAAQEAFSKIEQVVREEMRKKLETALQQMEQEKKEMKEQLEQQVEEQVESLRPQTIQVTVKDEATKQETQTEIKNAHPMLAEVLRRINCGIRNFLLVGPSGSIKTTIVEQVAEALSLPYSVTHWTAGTTEGTVLGRMTPDGKYLPSAYVTAFEMASVHNWDEFDAADPNVPICANSGLANGKLFLPARIGNEKAIRHARAYLFATANTWGVGADMMFVGRNQMDASTKSRFAGGMIFVDYDTKLEASLVPEDELRDAFWGIRSNILAHKLRRVWGTRELLEGAKLYRGGYTVEETLRVLTTGFTPDEMMKVGIPV